MWSPTFFFTRRLYREDKSSMGSSLFCKVIFLSVAFEFKESLFKRLSADRIIMFIDEQII